MLVCFATQSACANNNDRSNANIDEQKNLPLVQKNAFTSENFITFGGKTIPSVTVGWESYGNLNAAKDNVILITHYFTGNSHAAGKYQLSDTTAGYWNDIIGPGKAIDTDRFYVISVDSLANLGVHDPNVITTGPASINPATGKPYGLDFPVVTIRDFVNVQKQLLTSLGISKLYAVVGPSMGSMQALDWAIAYPEWVERMISVIGAGEADAWTSANLEHWASPIKLDKHWQQGNYYDSQPPVDGLVASLMLITQDALYPDFFNQVGEQIGFSTSETGPLEDIRQTPSIVNWLKKRAQARAETMDANHLLYLVRACQLYVAGHQGDLKNALQKVQAKTLFLPAATDLLLMPYNVEKTHQLLLDSGKDSQLKILPGTLGHLEGVTGISKHAELINSFLNK
ncbi:E22 family MetX-like putative esterase [Aliiglaciecola lipolytica]|uniref:Probable acyltransferase n=1 Tax=Aliiglaciecola lipolytica E3 TaxID=1127673 RepID=K6Y3U6_9ALTE|nr:homoserine O-acetyltransferase [Aliiglaciecola lipolytica E3]